MRLRHVTFLSASFLQAYVLLSVIYSLRGLQYRRCNENSVVAFPELLLKYFTYILRIPYVLYSSVLIYNHHQTMHLNLYYVSM